MAEVIAQENKEEDKKKPIRVDMTPMVDLGFLLITFFMVTTNFTKPNVMDLGLPAKDPNPNPINIPYISDLNQVTFILGKDNRVFYHQSNAKDLNDGNLKETDFSGVKYRTSFLKLIKSSEKENFTIIIKPTDDANYKNFVDVLDNIAISKKDRYGITDIKPWEKKVYENVTK